jgi:hypothetical protein
MPKSNREPSTVETGNRFQLDRTTLEVRPTKPLMDSMPQRRSSATRPRTPRPGQRPTILRKPRFLTARAKLRKFEGVSMRTKKYGIFIESPIEGNPVEDGPSLLALLAISICLAVLILGIVWLVFVRT